MVMKKLTQKCESENWSILDCQGDLGTFFSCFPLNTPGPSPKMHYFDFFRSSCAGSFFWKHVELENWQNVAIIENNTSRFLKFCLFSVRFEVTNTQVRVSTLSF